MYAEFTYEKFRRVSYGDNETGFAQFVPVCPICGRFVKADDTIQMRAENVDQECPNATCKKCGRVEMPFEGWF
jgi:hypothetical protein